jgi:DNA-binding GntR family transcriptional regulator
LIAVTGRPLYVQVADDLRTQIASGRLAVNAEIPATSQLVKQYGVSTGVVRAAVKVLQDEGILIGQSGKAVYVRATPDVAAEAASALTSVDDQIAELRGEVRRLADLQPSEVVAKIEELRAEVGRLQADLRHLYDRLGQPYPHGRSDTKQKRRTPGA